MPFLDFRMPSGYSHTGRCKMTRRWKGGSHSWLDQRPLRSTRAAPPQIPLALRSKVWLNGQKGYYLTKQLATTKISKIATFSTSDFKVAKTAGLVRLCHSLGAGFVGPQKNTEAKLLWAISKALHVRVSINWASTPKTNKHEQTINLRWWTG